MSNAITIVVIDDDASVREATSGLLRSFGYFAVTYGSAEEFLESTDTLDASCVISDVRMPGMDGFTLQSTLIERQYDVPLILMTAFAEKGGRERALAAGALEFLTKPYREQVLLESVASAVGARHR